MKIVVTGRSGQLAQAIAHVNQDHHQTFIGRPELDFAAPAAVREAILRAEPQAIINCAAFTHVDRCETDIRETYLANTEGPAQLAAIADEMDIPIVHVSTDYVFDGEARRPYLETDAENPLNVYGRSKLDGEKAVAANAARHVIARVSWVYSAYSDNFLVAMLKLANSAEEIRVVDDQISCPTPAVELAQALLEITARMSGQQDYGVFHLAGASAVDRASLAEAVMTWAAENGRRSARVVKVPTAAFPTPAVRPLYSVLDCSKIKTIYGVSLPPWQDWLSPCLRTIVDKRITT